MNNESKMLKEIYSAKILIAQIIDMNIIEGVSFPTPDSETFQFGFGNIEKRKELIPHIHKRGERTISTTSEFLYVVSGEMEIHIYGEDEKFIEKIILKDNQGLLQFTGGHKIVIEKGTKYFEIKQGPYYGRNFDKYNLEIK